MSDAIKRRILTEVKRRIEAGERTFICLALGEIRQEDHRRNVARLCDELTQQFQAGLEGQVALGGYLAAHGLPNDRNTRTLARLAWLDKMISEL